MSNRIFSTLRNSNLLIYYNFSKVNNHLVALAATQRIRHLYSKATLGIDGFCLQREAVNRQMQNISEKFKEKMAEYTEENASMIFTEDLKNMVHLANEEDDLELVVKMIKRFNKQNKQLRFGSYIFGPVVMRLLHHFNKPDIALECFTSPELDGFFDQLMSYQVLLDLLYENKMYNEVLETSELIKNKQIEGSKYPRNIIVLILAACYKLNTQESLDYALKLWQELKDVGHFPMRRATTFCAGLALNQGQPGIALEILTSAKNQHYTTVRNLKVAALAEVGRVENAIPILKSILSLDDVPGNQNFKHTFNKEVLDRVRDAVAKAGNPDVSSEFNKLEQIFIKQGYLSPTSLDEQLCQEIQKPPQMNNRQDRSQPMYNNRPYPQRERRTGNYQSFQQRPGLNDLV